MDAHRPHKARRLDRYQLSPPKCTASLYAVAGQPLYHMHHASQTATRVLAKEHSTNFMRP